MNLPAALFDAYFGIDRIHETVDTYVGQCENLLVGLEPDDRRACSNLATYDAIWQMRVCQRCKCEYEPPYSGTEG